jgi:adenosine kinase
MFERDTIESVLPYTDYVFCNEDEQAEMQKAIGCDHIGEWLAKIEKKNMNRPKRVVIMTQGAEPTQVVTCDHSTADKDCLKETVEVPHLEKDKIVDTNGAGDSFVGGFFSGIIAGEDVRKSVQMGNELARIVVQNSGCQFESE